MTVSCHCANSRLHHRDNNQHRRHKQNPFDNNDDDDDNMALASAENKEPRGRQEQRQRSSAFQNVGMILPFLLLTLISNDCSYYCQAFTTNVGSKNRASASYKARLPKLTGRRVETKPRGSLLLQMAAKSKMNGKKLDDGDADEPKNGDSINKDDSKTPPPPPKTQQQRRRRRSEETLWTLIQAETSQGRWFQAQDLWHEYIRTYPTAYNYVKFAQWAEEQAGDVILARAIFESLLRTKGTMLKVSDVKQPSILRKWASFEERQGEYERAKLLKEQIRQLLLQQSSKYNNNNSGQNDTDANNLHQQQQQYTSDDDDDDGWSRNIQKLQSVFPQSSQIMDAQELEEKASSRVWSSSSTVSSNTVTTSDALSPQDDERAASSSTATKTRKTTTTRKRARTMTRKRATKAKVKDDVDVAASAQQTVLLERDDPKEMSSKTNGEAAKVSDKTQVQMQREQKVKERADPVALDDVTQQEKKGEAQDLVTLPHEALREQEEPTEQEQDTTTAEEILQMQQKQDDEDTVQEHQLQRDVVALDAQSEQGENVEEPVEEDRSPSTIDLATETMEEAPEYVEDTKSTGSSTEKIEFSDQGTEASVDDVPRFKTYTNGQAEARSTPDTEAEKRRFEQEEQELRRLESVFPQSAQKLTAEQLEAMATSIWSQKEPEESNWLGEYGDTDISNTYIEDDYDSSRQEKFAGEEENEVDSKQRDFRPPAVASPRSFFADLPPPQERAGEPTKKYSDWVTPELRNLPAPNNHGDDRALQTNGVSRSPQADVSTSATEGLSNGFYQPQRQQYSQPMEQYSSSGQASPFQAPQQLTQEQVANFQSQQQMQQIQQQQLFEQQQQQQMMQQQLQQQQWMQQQQQLTNFQQQQQQQQQRHPSSAMWMNNNGNMEPAHGQPPPQPPREHPSVQSSAGGHTPLPYWMEEKGAGDTPPPLSDDENDIAAEHAAASILHHQQRQEQPSHAHEHHERGLLEDLGQSIMGFFQKPKDLLPDLSNRQAPIDDDQEQALLAALEAMNAAGSDEAAILDAAELISQALGQDQADQ